MISKLSDLFLSDYYSSTGDKFIPSVGINAKLLLHCNGANGSTSIIDSSSSAKLVSVYGGAQISTAQSKFGGSSLYLPGTDSYLTIPSHADWNSIRNGAFTFELQVMLISLPAVSSSYYFIARGSGSAQWNFSLENSNGTYLLTFYSNNGGGSNYNYIGNPWSVATNTWYHVAIIINNTTLKFFVDGIQIGTTSTISLSYIPSLSNELYIGKAYGMARYFNGYMDEVRLSDVVCDPSLFPPSAEYAA